MFGQGPKLAAAWGARIYASGDINRPATDRDIYQLLVEASSDILVRASLDGAILYVSPACRILGYAPEELLGVNAATLVHPDDLEQFLSGVTRDGIPLGSRV